MTNTFSLNSDFKEKYNVKEVLHDFHGGQKAVFLVELKSGEKVALKIFHPFEENDGREERMEKEIELYKKYSEHSGIPKIIDLSEHEGRSVLIEEYIEGQTLKELMEGKEYHQDSEKIKQLLTDVIGVLKALWEDGLVHRDLKPDNIIITPEGKPVIIDFGIVKDLSASTITETGFQPNSWKFAAPEQVFAKKEQISYRTDFFSLGVIAYYLYHDKLPFGDTREDVRNELGKSDSCPVCDEACSLSDFIYQVCKINPSERPRTVELLLNAIGT